MRTTLLMLAATLICAGCASLQEARYTDASFGEANKVTWEAQKAFPDRPFAKNMTEGLDGIHAERVMDVHNNTYGAAPSEEVSLFDLELSGN